MNPDMPNDERSGGFLAYGYGFHDYLPMLPDYEQVPDHTTNCVTVPKQRKPVQTKLSVALTTSTCMVAQTQPTLPLYLRPDCLWHPESHSLLSQAIMEEEEA